MQAESSSQDAALQQLSAILEKLETTPDNVPLIKSQIRLMGRLQMNAEVLDATLRLASLIMLSEDEWLSYFDRLIVPSIDLEAFVNIIERFEQAEQDYLSLAILLRHVEFIIGASNSSIVVNTTEEPLSVDPEVQAFLTPEAVREMLHNVVAKGHGLLTESHLLWQPWINWEMSLPGANSESVHELFAKRMAIPHSAFEATSSTYSSYCSENCPEEYERRLVDITTIAQTAKFKWSGEKRFGKTREILEADLPTSFLSYIEWETDPRAQNPKNAKSPSSDPLLTRSIFERAIAHYARAAHAAEEALALLTKPKSKGKGRQEKSEEIQAGERTISAYKTAEANIWERYATWDSELSVRQRAVRACPSIGSAWRHYMNQAELSVPDELPSIFQKALDLGLIVGPSEISDIFVCRAASVNRLNASSGSAPESIIQLASQAFELINHASRAGDPILRLEKFLLDWSESYADGRLDDVLRLLDKPVKSRAASYQMVVARANVEARNGLINKARETFSSALQRTDLDWPEAVFEAFLQFENVHGDLSTLTETTSLLEAEQLKLAKRRERAQQTIEYVAEAPVDVQMELPVEETADKIAEVAPAPPPAEDDGRFKRDREHTTVLVTGLAGHVEKAEVEAYFVEIGHVREVTLKSKDGQSHALVEFRFADAVPIALDRDGKKLGSNTIRVSMLWRSNLFVTNFPKETDDAALRGMFGQYGTVLDSRWPSRKYADSRRFCYITMDSPAHAQEALVLNGLKLGDFPLTVLISDPSAKSKRTDADDSVNRTLFVGGLTAKTTEHDVEDILRPYGRAQHVKLGWDPIKRICKGFAFVQMETEDTAKACLTLDGSQRQGKFLKIQMSDPNHVNKKPVTTSATGARNAADKRQRTVRLHNLPEGTQEGLLQQALEKIAPVKRVEIFGKSSEAIAELANQSDVGTLLLRAEPFVFNGATITISQQDRRQPHKRDETPASALSFAPRAARRGGKVIGKPRPVAVPVAAQGQDTFRQFVQSKNAELAEGKRKAEEDDENMDAKRQKAE